MKNFFFLLVKKRRIFFTSKILDSFLRLCLKKRGEIKASLISSKELSENELESIRKDLSSSMGSTIKFDYRIDKELIKKYKKNVIALSGNMFGVIPKLILNQGIEAAEEELKWWLDTFGEDFYLELNRHDIDEENHVKVRAYY